MKGKDVYIQDMILAIKQGGKNIDLFLKKLVQDYDLNEAIKSHSLRMGALVEDGIDLFDDALISLLSKGKKGTLDGDLSIRDCLIEETKIIWAAQLVQDQKKRSQVMDYVALDTLLKKRVQIKMRKLGCRNEEGSDYYNQGFIKLDEVLRKGKYRGGDVKGFFLRICENTRLNDLRKIRENLPEILPEKGRNEIVEKIEYQERKNLMKKWLEQIGEKCQKTLQMWNDGYSMKEIAVAIPYRDHMEAAVAKHRCLKKIFKLIDVSKWT